METIVSYHHVARWLRRTAEQQDPRTPPRPAAPLAGAARRLSEWLGLPRRSGAPVAACVCC